MAAGLYTIEEAQKASKQGNHVQARAILSEVLKQDPGNEHAYLL